jgi:chitin disaccharide deacetylase
MEKISDSLVLISADDFGLSSAVNCAIVEELRSGRIDMCTIMANFPAFEEAADAANADRFTARIGLHFVLDEGVPLSEKLRREPRFCGPDGRMRSRRRGSLIHLSSSEQRAVADELRAQIARCRSSGLPLTYLTSHHHIHEEFGIIRVVLSVMREQGIAFIRPMQNLHRCRTLIRRMYTCAFNTELRRHRVVWTQYFGSVGDYLTYCSLHGAPPNATIELMVHPTMAPDGTIADRFENASLSEAIGAARAYRRLAIPTNVPGWFPLQPFS